MKKYFLLAVLASSIGNLTVASAPKVPEKPTIQAIRAACITGCGSWRACTRVVRVPCGDVSTIIISQDHACETKFQACLQRCHDDYKASLRKLK